MDFYNFIDLNYIVFTFLLSLLISKKINTIIKVNNIVLMVLFLSFFVPVINIILNCKVINHFIEFLVIWILVYKLIIENLSESLFIATVFSLCFSVCRYVLFFTGATVKTYSNHFSLNHYEVLIVFEILYLISLVLFALFINYIINVVLENKKFTYKELSIVFVFLIAMLLTGKIFDKDSINSEIVYRAAISSVFISIDMGIICIYFHKKYKDLHLQFQLEKLENQLKSQEKYYENLLKNYDYARRAKHDLNNHLNIIKYFVNTKDYEALDEYLNKVGEFFPESKNFNICNNKVINAMCVEKKKKCTSMGIDINFNIDIPSEVELEPVILCVVFGNLLDNAVEACEKIKTPKIKKFIEVSSKIEFNKLYIRVINSKGNTIFRKKGRFITSKKNKSNHGIGIDNVKYAVYKNNGHVTFKDSNSVFEVNLYMDLSKIYKK